MRLKNMQCILWDFFPSLIFSYQEISLRRGYSGTTFIRSFCDPPCLQLLLHFHKGVYTAVNWVIKVVFSIILIFCTYSESTKNSLLAIVVLDCCSYWQQMSADIDLLSILSDRMRYKGKLSVLCVSQCPVLIKN